MSSVSVVQDLVAPQAGVTHAEDQHSTVCHSVREFLAVLMTLKMNDYTTRFNFDGTWTITMRSPVEGAVKL